MGARGPTGKQVARHAHVSQSTVSLVLSGRAAGRVSARTQEIVVRAAEELGYRPHAAGRSLRLGHSGLLLMLVPEVSHPFHARVLDGALQAAHADGCALVLGSGAYGSLLAHTPTTVDGVLACGMGLPDPGPAGGRMPSVVVEAATPAWSTGLRLDTGAGMSAAVEHLRSLGHHRIGYVRALGRGTTSGTRYRSFRRATAGVAAVVRPAPVCAAGAEPVAMELLAATDRVTAIVCDDELQAAGVYRAASRLGIAVPTGLSVVGFGDTPVARLLFPDLTTVELTGEELGRRGVELLLELVRGGRPPRRSVLPTRLVHRASTARPG